MHLYVYVYVLIVLSLMDCTSSTYTVVPERGQNNCDGNKNWLHDEKHSTIKSNPKEYKPICCVSVWLITTLMIWKSNVCFTLFVLRVWNTFAVTMHLKSIQNYVHLPFLLNAESAHDNY